MPPTEGELALAAARIGAARHKSYWVRAWRSTTQQIAAGATGAVSFDKSEVSDNVGVFDHQNMHDPIGDPTKFYCRMVRGMYRVDAYLEVNNNPGTGTFLRLNGTSLLRPFYDVTSGGTNPRAIEGFRTRLNSNDYLELYIDNGGGGSIITVSSLPHYGPILQIELQSAEHG